MESGRKLLESEPTHRNNNERDVKMFVVDPSDIELQVRRQSEALLQ